MRCQHASLLSPRNCGTP
eukprot:CCRYP_005000-RA/>CCRYP_005000-RA protein AED:0.43 eAED:0.56 QI:0/-1/0/1/-1/0/1/0/17